MVIALTDHAGNLYSPIERSLIVRIACDARRDCGTQSGPPRRRAAAATRPERALESRASGARHGIANRELRPPVPQPGTGRRQWPATQAEAPETGHPRGLDLVIRKWYLRKLNAR
jgi:hypothetical protein